MLSKGIKPISPKQFVLATLSLSLFFGATFAGIFYYTNDFGLWKSKEDIRIWGREKTSKYLLSFKYIPENFEGVVLGASVSVNLDTRLIENHKIYNLSMNGANISELKYAAENVLSHQNTKYLILCLHPYITKDSGIKGRQIDPKEYWGSIFSFLPVEMLVHKYKAASNPKLDKFNQSEWGYFEFQRFWKRDFKDIVETKEFENEIIVDPTAYEELQRVINLAHDNQVQVLAYYYPTFYDWQQQWEANGAWNYYRQKMQKLFDENDIVLDLTTPDYYYITKNYASYTDGHLSDLGAKYVTEIISDQLNQLDKLADN